MKFFAVIAVVVIALAVFSVREPAPAPTVAVVGEEQAYSLATIEVVRTPAERQQGLSNRADIPEDYGMLFVFEEEGDYGFWMKDMLVSIDMLWLADDGAIIGITADVSPDTYPQTFHPPSPVRYVLETRAGEAQRKGWSIGTKLSLPL